MDNKMDFTKKWVIHLRNKNREVASARSKLDHGSDEDEPPTKRPPPATKGHQRGSSQPITNSIPRSRARPTDSANTFERPRNTSGRQLWSEDDDSHGRPIQGRSIPLASPAHRQSPPNKPDRTPQISEPEPVSQIMLQPETRPISQDQLVAEVKGIYACLVMVETKCIEVDNAQSPDTGPKKLDNEQWQALIALYRTLLHEHHDFFLASQHPSASPSFRRLAAKYAMPARMWRHGIHSFLELLRHKLPESTEHMLTFLYLAYSMMALLYETVPAFEETWIECLGDLGRYRMAIEDDDIRDREVWSGVSRHWYSKASDEAPVTGRLYHHLAILARPNALQQLYYYTKSLSVPVPFLSARESVMALFERVLNHKPSRLAPTDAAFVRVHGVLFSGKSQDMLEVTEEFFALLDHHIDRITNRWLKPRYYISTALGWSLSYGLESNVLWRILTPHQRQDDTTIGIGGNSILEEALDGGFDEALSFADRTYETVLRRCGDPIVLPFIHTTPVFIYQMHRQASMAFLEREFPWEINLLRATPEVSGGHNFPSPDNDEFPPPLPEDFAMRGFLYTDDHLPSGWFTNDMTDEVDDYDGYVSMARKRRLAYLDDHSSTSSTRKRSLLNPRQWSVTDTSEYSLLAAQVDIFCTISQMVTLVLSSGYLDFVGRPPPVPYEPYHGLHSRSSFIKV